MQTIIIEFRVEPGIDSAFLTNNLLVYSWWLSFIIFKPQQSCKKDTYYCFHFTDKKVNSEVEQINQIHRIRSKLQNQDLNTVHSNTQTGLFLLYCTGYLE